MKHFSSSYKFALEKRREKSPHMICVCLLTDDYSVTTWEMFIISHSYERLNSHCSSLYNDLMMCKYDYKCSFFSTELVSGFLSLSGYHKSRITLNDVWCLNPYLKSCFGNSFRYSFSLFCIKCLNISLCFFVCAFSIHIHIWKNFFYINLYHKLMVRNASCLAK